MPDADTPPPAVRAADSRQVAELRALLEKITPLPWAFNTYCRVDSEGIMDRFLEVERAFRAAGKPWDAKGDYADEWKPRFAEVDPSVCEVPPTCGDTATGRHLADAEFIVAAANALPALLTLLRDARALIADEWVGPDGPIGDYEGSGGEWLRRYDALLGAAGEGGDAH